MTTTTEQSTALATRSLSGKQLRTRIELAERSFGLQGANQTQLNIVYLLCQRWDLDPLTDITLFEGRPFVTIDGRLRLLRRHPEYRGYRCHPLTRDDKLAWGYEADDIVVECSIRTTTWGEISARGKVTWVEVKEARDRAERSGKRSAPIGVHPVEIAEKRAIARAERAAFGQDMVLDEEEAITIIEERKDPVTVAAHAAEYDRIYGADDGSTYHDLPDGAADPSPPAAQPETRAEAEPPPVSARRPPSRADLWNENRRLTSKAVELGIQGVPTVANRSGDDVLVQANEDLADRIRKHEAELVTSQPEETLL